MFLLFDGCEAHVQYNTLKLLKDNNIIVIALLAHTSHITQPVEVTIFNSYKSHMQNELYNAARQTQKLNVFEVVQRISNAYASSHTPNNIRSGINKIGIWDMELMGPNVAPLRYSMMQTCGRMLFTVTIEQFLAKFDTMHCTLLRDAVVEEYCRVRINTTADDHLTFDVVLEAVNQRKSAQEGRRREAEDRELTAEFKEPKSDIRGLVQLAPVRKSQRYRLVQTRKAQRELRRAKACVRELACGGVERL